MSMIWKVLTRKKVIDPVSVEETQLSRVLNTFDLTALGVGSTLGVGVYVLVGHVAKDVAGPSVILSFLLAAIASVFAGLCYAEFGARAPRAGSAYIYSYVCVGEFVAFVIGWNLILEYVIGSASVARGLSLYFDALINDTLQTAFIDIAPINAPYLSRYFDFFAFTICVLLAVALAFGMKESSWVNNIFTVLNIFVVGFVVVAGALNADPANWNISPNGTSANATNVGKGGFFPFGIEGMIKGAATCFYGFVGFDCIATTAEEVKNPKRAIPISIILSLFIIFLAYFGTSTVVTLMVPFYLQDPGAPIPYAFEHIGWYTAKWIVSIGGMFGLFASLFGAMFPLPRIVYAMASDSLVFKFLGKVHSRFQTPVVGTLLCGLLTGLMAALFDLAQLVNMMSIGTLLAYTIVAASVLLLRYAREDTHLYMPVQTVSDSDDSETYTENKTYNNSDEATTSEEKELLEDSSGSVFGQIFNCGGHKSPTKTSEKIVTTEVFIYCITCVLMGLCAIYLRGYIGNGEIWAIVLTAIVVFIAVIVIILMVTQPTSKKELSFKVPLVPLIPALSILINTYLMLMLDTHTWIRFAVWMAIGLPIYYFSVKPYTEAQNKDVSSNNSIDYNATLEHPKQNGKLNGISNVAFVADENVNSQLENEITETKKRFAPQPPTQTNGISYNDIQAEITKLDEILEAADSSLDDDVVGRKLSVDTVSNVSDCVSREENVVAVVHRDNVVTPAISKAPSFSSEKKDSISDSNEPPIAEIQGSKPVETGNKPEDIENETPTEVILQNEIQKEASVTSQSPDLPKMGNVEGTNDLRKNSSDAITIPTPPPSPASPIFELKMEQNHQIPVPPPLLSLTPSADEFKIIRPTTSNLRSVTLRPTKRSKIPHEEEKYEPGEENLKVGSEKYMNFLQSLNGKLQNMNIVPNYIPFMKRPHSQPAPVVQQEELRPNENVVEDSINKMEAMEKLGNFISDPSRNKGILGNVSFFNEKPKDNEDESETDKIKDDANLEDEDKTSVSTDRTSHGDFIEHKDRMQNVFRSMNLKTDAPEHVESRNVKTLGPSFFGDEKSQHRQAMGEIFKTINLMRKDSQK